MADQPTASLSIGLDEIPDEHLLSLDRAAHLMRLPETVVLRALEQGDLRGMASAEPGISARTVQTFLAARAVADAA